MQMCHTLMIQFFNISQFNLLSARHANVCTRHDMKRVAFKAPYVTTPHDSLHDPTLPLINSPAVALQLAGVRSRSFAFQGTHPLVVTLDSSSVTLDQTTSHRSITVIYDSSRILFKTNVKNWWHAWNDQDEKSLVLLHDLGTTGTNVCTAREPPRRCGYTEGWEPAFLPADRDGPWRGGKGMRELDT